MTKDVEDGFHSDNYQQTCTTIIDYLQNAKVLNISTRLITSMQLLHITIIPVRRVGITVSWLDNSIDVRILTSASRGRIQYPLILVVIWQNLSISRKL